MLDGIHPRHHDFTYHVCIYKEDWGVGVGLMGLLYRTFRVHKASGEASLALLCSSWILEVYNYEAIDLLLDLSTSSWRTFLLWHHYRVMQRVTDRFVFQEET